MTLPNSDDFATHELCASELDAISGGLFGGIGGLIGGIPGGLISGLLGHHPNPPRGGGDGYHSPHPTHLQLPPFLGFPFGGFL